MFKIKAAFVIITVIVSALLIINFLKFDLDVKELIYKNETIRITGFSPDSYLFKDQDMRTPLSFDEIDFGRNQNIMTPKLVSIEFLYRNTFLEVHPLTYVEFDHKLLKLTILFGEFYWERVGKGSTEVSLGSSLGEIELSGRGKLKLSTEGELSIWNFKGSTSLSINAEKTELEEETFYIFPVKKKRRKEKILPAPGSISPLNRKVYLKAAKDSILKFECRAVPNASGYIFRLYSSKLRENVLTEKTTVANRTNFNLGGFEGRRNFYWNVAPINENNFEGEPSVIGNIMLFGSSYEESLNLQPPELTIISLTVNGTLVLIKGKAETGSTLFIDNIPVPLEQDGSFIFTKIYKSMGLKTITFRAVSETEVENVITRQVTIFEE